MFDLIVKGHRRTPHRDTAPMMMSLGLHAAAAAMLVVIPLMAYDVLPAPPSMMSAFAAAPPPPPPPPPPPAEAPPKRVVELNPEAAPVEAPMEIAPEPPADTSVAQSGSEGVPGGIVGGVASLKAPAPAPPPPPAPAPEAGPVRIGGEIRQPALLSRVAPVYPALAVQAQVEGLVILQVVVDREGRVEDVRVLRLVPILNMAAIEAVRQWRYEPLMLNGHHARFIVTVTVAFQLTRDGQ